MLTYYEMLEKTPKYWTRIKYTQFGNSMRSLALLRWLLAGGRFLEVVGACCVQLVPWKTGFWLLVFFLAFFRLDLLCKFHWELDCVGMCWVLSLWNLEMWLFWNDMQDWCIAGFSPEYLNYFILLLLLLLLLLLPLLLLFDTSCYYHCLIF